MRIRWILGCFLVLLLGGCITTSHEHFRAADAGPVPLASGVYDCAADTASLPNREGRPPPSILSSDSRLALFFKPLIIEKVADNESRVLLGTGGEVHVFAFHRLAGDVYASGFPGKERGTYHTWFFRITENRLSLLFMRESDVLDAIAAKTGVLLRKEVPISPNIRGSKEEERAFIDELVGSGMLIPASNCRFVK